MEGLNEWAERVFGPLAQQMIDRFLYVKLHPKLKNSKNLAYSESGRYEQIVTQL